MPHIHTEHGEHDHTVSAYIVRTDLGDEPKIMLHMHKKIGKYLQFGGHVELNENPWQAMTHELLEETGYDMDQLQVLQPAQRIKALHNEVLHPVPVCYNTHAFDQSRSHFHTDIDFALVAGEAPRHPLGEGESDNIIYLTKEELLTQPNVYENVRIIGLFVLETCMQNWDRVPATSYN